MKKYRLIREYPGSPKLGTIEEVEDCFKNLMMGSNGKYLYNISESPEFWELVIEKDYEILSLISTRIDKTIITYQNGGGCYGENFFPYVYKSIDHWVACFTMNNNPWQIHSVKRLSDGEIFTIGDNVSNIYDRDITIINKFEFNHDTITINSNYAKLSEINKSKQPLFTTEDGVDIFEGDSYVALLSNYDLTQEKAGFNHDNIYCHCLKFSTKEKAEEYILYNKPLLTLKDIEELLCKNTSSYFLEKFKKRAQKLNNKN